MVTARSPQSRLTLSSLQGLAGELSEHSGKHVQYMINKPAWGPGWCGIARGGAAKIAQHGINIEAPDIPGRCTRLQSDLQFRHFKLSLPSSFEAATKTCPLKFRAAKRSSAFKLARRAC